MKIISFLLCAFFSYFAFSYVSIDIGKAHVRKSQMAIQPFLLVSPADSFSLNLGTKIFNILNENLSFSGYFRLLDQEAFLEKPGEKTQEPYPNDPNGFLWKNWQILNADYLLTGRYLVKEKKIILTVYLYHVSLKRKVFQKEYKASAFLVQKLADIISNEILEKLTNKPGIFLSKIATVRDMSGQKKEIFTMKWNGKKKKRISFHNSIVLSPFWSPKGNYIGYTAFLHNRRTNKRNTSLLLYNRVKKHHRIVFSRGKMFLGSQFFPDGKYILASLFLGKGNMDIAKLLWNGSALTPLTFGPNGSINVEPFISPSQKKIIFSSDRGGKVRLYSMKANGKQIRPILLQGSYNSTPRYSPDGGKIVFSGYSRGRFDIFLMKEDGSDLKRLTSSKKNNGQWADNESPSFSPDGRYIVFTSNKTGYYQLYIMNLSNSEVIQITNDKYNYKSPRWSPSLK